MHLKLAAGCIEKVIVYALYIQTFKTHYSLFVCNETLKNALSQTSDRGLANICTRKTRHFMLILAEHTSYSVDE